MKNILLGSLALCATLSANASMLEVNGPLDSELYEAKVTQEKSYFETLGDLFSEGTVPNPTKISNIAWSGRCFLKENPNEPTNAGYIFRKKRISDVGPIDQRVKVYEAFSYWNLSKAPNFYDDMSMKQVLEYYNSRIIPFEAKFDSEKISVKISATDSSSLKISGSYLVEELTSTMSDAGPLAKTFIYGRCYYFIPDLDLE